MNSSLVISGAFAQCALRSPTGAAALEDPTAPQDIVFASEPEQEEDRELLRRAVEVLRPQRVTIIVTERPFAPAIAASRGEQPRDVEAWLEELASSVAGHQLKLEGQVVTSFTGYTLCDVVEGLEADLLVVKAEPDGFQDIWIG